MDTRNLICIGCPLGCEIKVTLNELGEIENVEGNSCPRGDTYSRKEVTNPTRIVTTAVRVFSSYSGAVTVSCKTKSDIPKSRIFNVMRELKYTAVSAPVHIGDVIKQNVANTGVDIVATKEIW